MPSASIDLDLYNPERKVRNLGEVGSAVEVDAKIPLRRYYRSGKEMLRMADVYAKEGNLENAFILYTKFITLFVEKIQRHPDKINTASPEWAFTKKKLKEVFPVAESLKAKLLRKYEDEYKHILKEKERQDSEQNKSEDQKRKQQVEQLLYEQQRLLALQQKSKAAGKADTTSPSAPIVSPSDVFPTLIDLENSWQDSRHKNPPASSGRTVIPDVPSRDVKPDVASPVDVIRRPIPPVDRSTKPMPLLSPEPFFHGLRTVVVPGGLFSKFLKLASRNTEKNIETCAILAGKLSKNQLNVSHVLVPKQSGSSDSCFTESEEEVLEYQDRLGLDTVGWVHTHPTQTAFMSSVDLHTHCSYQLMLPEAIAVVCSPKYEENKIFSLTVDHGLSYISNCNLSGFHPHPKEPPLYEECKHVKIDEKAPVTVVDLRT
ncbi:STAM-binding protein-like [Ornithodoros turicata]|uniref:STAM-binding protein-like n=1 Tax=Ornithodoros turicata TaxID=34597 RepID=UPI00313A0D42